MSKLILVPILESRESGPPNVVDAVADEIVGVAATVVEVKIDDVVATGALDEKDADARFFFF